MIKSILLIAEGEELLVRKLGDELLSTLESLKKLNKAIEKKNQYIAKLELENQKLKSHL